VETKREEDRALASTAAALQYRMELESRVMRISTRFVNIPCERIDEAVTQAMQEIGEFIGAGLVFIIQLAQNRTTLATTHQWYAPGVTPKVTIPPETSIEKLPSFAPRLLQGETITADTIAQLPLQTPFERSVLQAEGIRSLIVVPLTMKGQVSGCIGFATIAATHAWTEDEIRICRLVGEIIANAIEHKRADQELRWLNVDLENLVAERTRMLEESVVSHQSELAAHRQTTAGLEARERTFQALMNAPDDRVFLIGPDYRILDANAAAWRGLGRPRDELVNACILDFMPLELVRTRKPMLDRALATGEVVRFEDVRDDRFFDHTLYPVLDPQGKVISLVILARDITERKHSERSLQQARDDLERRVTERTRGLRTVAERLSVREAQYRNLIENATEAICSVTEFGVFTFVNAAGAKALDRSPEDIVGKTMWDVFPAANAERHMAAIRRVIETGQPLLNTEAPSIVRGQPRWFRTNITPIRPTPESAPQVMIVARDVHKRKLAEDEVKTAALRLAEAQRIANVGSWELDLSTKEIYWSEQMYRLFDADPASFTPHYDTLIGWIHPDDRARLLADQAAGIQNRTGYRHEARMYTTGGRLLHLLSKVEVICDADGKVVKLAGTMLDITELREAEKRIAESETNFHSFFDSIDDLIFVVDKQGRILQANRTATQRLGFTDQELIGREAVQLHPADTQAEASLILAAMIRGEARECPFPLQSKQGDLIEVETRLARGKWNEQDVLFCISKDVSALRASEDKFATAFNVSPLPMGLVCDERFVEVNDALVRTSGYSREELLGKTSLEMNLYADPQQRSATYAQLAQTGSVREAEIQIRTRSGEIREGLLSVERIRLQNRDFLLAIIHDITERKRAERSLQRQLAMQAILTDAAARFLRVVPSEMGPAIQTVLQRIGEYMEADRCTLAVYDPQGAVVANEYRWTSPRAPGMPPPLSGMSRQPFRWMNARLNRGEPVIIEDVAALPAEAQPERENCLARGIKAAITFPLIAGQSCIGIFALVQERCARAWSSEDVDALRLLVDILGNAVNQWQGINAMQSALARLEEFESLINRSPAVVFLWRVAEGWPVEFVSRNVIQFGYTAEDLTSGRVSWPGITHPEDVPRLEADVRRHLEAKTKEFFQEYRLITKSGEVRWIDDHTIAIFDAQGRITHYQGIIVDVTLRHELAGKLRRSERELREALKNREKLAQDLHDRTIQSLYAIGLNLDDCRARLGRRARSMADELSKNIAQLNAVIQDIRGFIARIELNDRRGQKLEPALRLFIERMNPPPEVRIAEDIDPLACRRLTATQTDNLLSIAGEALSNSLRHARASVVGISVKSTRSGVTLRIADNGVGFDVNAGKRLGLGLKNILARATEMRAQIKIRSGPQKGTEVRVTVPIGGSNRKKAARNYGRK
jgi:PAS domain S-box-containing protein